ncbi:MAG: hypothetical protein KR126chlam1_00178 [Chlamydiae bacterium]|nr:hypothetical protein [Chlamydiota bacterium]
MALSKLRGSLYDPFRRAMVAATPEEIVRQKLLQMMVSGLGYPKELISVEKQLSELPHISKGGPLPKRRADIICFAANIHPEYPMYPLLLIECKEGAVGEDAKEQALGYNHYVQALYVGVAGDGHFELIFPKAVSFLPTYSALLEAVSLCK